MQGKMVIFCKELGGCCKKFAEDLPHKGMLFQQIEKNGVMVAVLILVLKSIHCIDDDSKSKEENLSTVAVFKLPIKKTGVHGMTAHKRPGSWRS
jgi:hypothetical protein